MKRALVSGGPGVAIGSPAGATFSDTSVVAGVPVYYVVSATNTVGESANSTEAGARAVSLRPPKLGFGMAGGELQFTWPADHTGWRVQAQTNSSGAGLGTNWITVAGSTNLNNVTVPMVPTNGSAFFRLVYP